MRWEKRRRTRPYRVTSRLVRGASQGRLRQSKGALALSRVVAGGDLTSRSITPRQERLLHLGRRVEPAFWFEAATGIDVSVRREGIGLKTLTFLDPEICSGFGEACKVEG